MRDLMFFVALLFLVPLSISDAFIAYLMWGWTALISIDSYLYGFVANFRLNFLFAIICIVLLIFRGKNNDGQWRLNRTNSLLLIWLIHGIFTAIFAYPDLARNWEIFENFVKVILFALLMPLVITDRYRIHAFVLIIALSLGFHGIIDGLKYIESGGAHVVQGIAKFGDNNIFAIIILMSIPFLLYLYKQSASKYSKYAAIGAAVLVILAVIGTRSRGGLLSLIALVLWLIFVSKRRVAGILTAFIIAIGVFYFAPSSWFERMDTIQSFEEDGSFLSRVESWQVSSAIAKTNPILGGGFRALENKSIWDRFRGDKGLLWFTPNFYGSKTVYRAAHSAYFEVLGDRGILGLLIYLTILVNLFYTCRETKLIAEKIGAPSAWIVDLSNAISASAVAFAIGTGGVSMAYTEMIYILAALAEILKQKVQLEYKR